VFVANKAIAFTRKEFDLLQYFMINRGKMLTHREILRAVWGPAHSDDAIYLRVYIGQIRRKIENCSTHHSMIKSECGIGYRMEVIAKEIPQPLFDKDSIITFKDGQPLHARRVQVDLINHSQSM
jgi:two-component system KDP operon response regulator KdpE